MQKKRKVSADSVTYVHVLKACCILGALHQGQQVHVQIQDRGIEVDVLLGTSLVDMYAKCGSLHNARNVLEKMPMSNVVSWTALLNGYALSNDSQKAIQCFDEMQQKGIRPDEAAFTCIFVACSHDGLVREANSILG